MHKNGLDSTRAGSKRRNDLILIALAAVAALLCMLWIAAGTKQGKYIRVTVNGTLQGEYSLEKDQVIDVVYEDENYHNRITVQDGKASVSEANCRDKICVNHKPVSKDGETIVCLPHKMVVEVVTDAEESEPGFDGLTN